MKKTVVAFGELLWDILPTDIILGGAPFNFVYRVNTVGDRGLIISRLGCDELGNKAFDEVVTLGLNTAYIQWDDEYPTGTVQVSFYDNNSPDYVIIPGVAYDYMEMKDELTDIAFSADCIYFGTLIQRTEKSQNTLEQFLDVSSHSLKFLDINLRKKCYSKETVVFSLDRANVLKLNEDEAFMLSGILKLPRTDIPGFCEIMTEAWSLRYCLVTLAEKGAFVFSDNGDAVYTPGYKVKDIDSLGSGDAFSAGFVHTILNGGTPREACELGNILGALVASKKGATATISQDEIGRMKHVKIERTIHQELERFWRF